LALAMKVQRGWIVERMIEHIEGNLLCPRAKA
jgi:hypothetical protein